MRDSVLIIGNLDCEVEWSSGSPLPRHVAIKIGALATSLRTLAPDGDDVLLWLPIAIDPARVPALAASPRWRVATTIPRDPPQVVVWGATSRVANVPGGDLGDDVPWRTVLPRLPVATTEIARRASDRRWAHRLAETAGAGLSGSRTITSIAELRAHLAAGGASASPDGAWVVKAPLSAAGRDRVRRRGATLDPATEVRIGRLLEHHRALVFEPWLDRVLDLGQPGLVTGPDRWRLLPPHRLHSDARGGFAGITIEADDGWLAIEHRRRLAEVAGAVAAALAGLGYRGAFTVDAFLHKDISGAITLQPLIEINPRLSFGLVARAWAERLGMPLTLRVAATAPPPSAIVLVAPIAGDPTAMWLEPIAHRPTVI